MSALRALREALKAPVNPEMASVMAPMRRQFVTLASMALVMQLVVAAVAIYTATYYLLLPPVYGSATIIWALRRFQRIPRPSKAPSCTPTSSPRSSSSPPPSSAS